MQLKGKIALITGAGSGIGRALAADLCARGAQTILVGRRLEPLLQTKSMLPRPELGIAIAADVTESTDRGRLAREVASLGRLDILVNNAGLMAPGPLSPADTETRRRMVETNLLAPMEVTLSLLPLLKAATPSRVVNVGSVLGDIAFPYFATYSASKFGLRGWSDALRRELSDSGVGVTYAAPRSTRTPATESFAPLVAAFGMQLDPPERVARWIAAAIAKDVDNAYPKSIERLFVLVQRLLPGLVDRSLSRQAAKVATQLATDETRLVQEG